MSDSDQSDVSKHPDQPGKTRTWWHPLLARLLTHALATAYEVNEEVAVGTLPLRVDILLMRRGRGRLSEAARKDLAVLLPLLNRFTLMQLKGPTDALQRGDFAQHLGCAFLWHSQQPRAIAHRDTSLIVLAPRVNKPLRAELRLLGCTAGRHERGVFHVTGLPLTTWLVKTDVMAERGQAILSMVSNVFLRDRRRIMEQLSRTGHVGVLSYTLQQIQQFRSLGEDFAMQHKDTQYIGEVEEDVLEAILAATPPEKRLRGLPAEERLRGLPAEERLRGLPPEERLRGLSPEEMAAALSEEQAARLRELLERKQGR